jgi:glyceraldehyde-3-phosphate dehydrogenase type I
VDVVLESTGIFQKQAVVEDGKVKNDGYDEHIIARAKKIILSVPSADEIKRTLVLGVNNEHLTPTAWYIWNASGIANGLAPLVNVLKEAFDIINGFVTAIHSCINDQIGFDAMHADLRCARAAHNIIPTSTGEAIALPRVVKDLTPKSLDGISFRVLTLTRSLIDVTPHDFELLNSPTPHRQKDVQTLKAPLLRLIQLSAQSDRQLRSCGGR